MTLRADFDYTPSPLHDIKFGANYTYHTFSPDVSSFKQNVSDDASLDIDTVIGSPKVYAHEIMSYIEDNISLGKMFKLSGGTTFLFVSRAKQGLLLVTTGALACAC